MNWTQYQVARMIDHTNLRAYATQEDFRRLCDEARANHFRSVAINSYPVRMCREMLKGSDVLTGAAIAFPLGQTSMASKAAEVENAISDGCQEFDYVLNVGRLKMHDYAYIEKEMRTLVALARQAQVCCKVIFETCYLTEQEIMDVSRIAADVRPDFVKTSTGFGTAGATPAHVALMKQYAGPDVQVKAAGGIRSWKDALSMLEAGATRPGTSSGLKILADMREAGLPQA